MKLEEKKKRKKKKKRKRKEKKKLPDLENDDVVAGILHLDRDLFGGLFVGHFGFFCGLGWFGGKKIWRLFFLFFPPKKC
jgi:hypothetical protein